MSSIAFATAVVNNDIRRGYVTKRGVQIPIEDAKHYWENNIRMVSHSMHMMEKLGTWKLFVRFVTHFGLEGELNSNMFSAFGKFSKDVFENALKTIIPTIHEARYPLSLLIAVCRDIEAM
jgi:hypothetical protein